MNGPTSRESQILLQDQFNFLAKSPTCIICGSKMPAELGMMQQSGQTKHFALCAECATKQGVNELVLEKLQNLERKLVYT
jgi:hypothetical protein